MSIYGDEEQHHILRQKVADEMERTWADIQPFLEIPVQKYITKIRLSRTWAGNLELSLIQRLFQREIIIMDADLVGNSRRVDIGSQASTLSNKNPIVLSYHGQRHYNAIVNENSTVALARSIEYFRIPLDVLTICVGKSTYARCGIIVNVTPLEPGWEGYVTLEFSNTTPLPAKIYSNEGVAQFIFLKGNEKPEVTYADRNGKYMGQTGVTLPKV